MRRQFVRTIQDLMAQDERLVLLLGDIGVFGFREAFAKHPERTFNIGICEQATIGLAAGLAREQLRPVVHSIAPFVVERCYEQLKVDFCYQRLGVSIVSVGASYDYASLGCTHHCPADVSVLKALPGMQIVVPGTAGEFDELFRATYHLGQPTYYRLSERCNDVNVDVSFGRASVVRQGHRGTVVAVGPTLGAVLAATSDLDVTILYYTTVAPFDACCLRDASSSDRIVLVEPFYKGTLASDVMDALSGRSVRLLSIGVPPAFLTHYGHPLDHDEVCGLTPAQIRLSVERFISE